jgi:hypothetical protein
MLLMENELDRWYAISKVDAMLKNIVESDHWRQISALQEFLINLQMGLVPVKDLWVPDDIWLDTGLSVTDRKFLTETAKLCLWMQSIDKSKGESWFHGSNFSTSMHHYYSQWMQKVFDSSVKHMYHRSTTDPRTIFVTLSFFKKTSTLLSMVLL